MAGDKNYRHISPVLSDALLQHEAIKSWKRNVKYEAVGDRSGWVFEEFLSGRECLRLQPLHRISNSSDSRTETSSSTTNTIGLTSDMGLPRSWANVRRLSPYLNADDWLTTPHCQGDSIRDLLICLGGYPATFVASAHWQKRQYRVSPGPSSEITVKARRGKIMEKMKAGYLADLVKMATKLYVSSPKS